ncbi:hypothetical protein EGC76_04690 [Pseudidiomarina gelatinasegens]|uniref:Uncharacterized protein n=1 Tax=Pseudidiomarina gelatinasegens TaxID=2487740 RepID=A0A451GEP5_9GAMM|nr:hypothetical protein [Pseudidiomarina gelatinasegens]RWU11565.1 hypothetical protein EGC76_04690 [Pseudidiomarina gelatinasegens]|tara:strand:+ start:105 stop:518 length:414 start_codon:yes stop_codon:yes gene_type:complete
MSVTTRLVILAGLVGLLFYNATEQQLWAVIIDWQLGWYKLGVPLAWGVILGALVNLLGGTVLIKWLEPITFVAASLVTLGLTGSAAIYGAHQVSGLVIVPLSISSIGVGMYLFAYSYARFTGARSSEKAKEAVDKKP